MSGMERHRADYERSLYVALDGKREVVARIGRMNPEIDRLLEARGAAELVFVTAWNPRGTKAPDAENAAATRHLKDMLEEEDLDWLPHEGRSPEGDWVEKGFAVFDLPPADALGLAETVGQLAIVWCAYDQPAAVLFTKLAM